MNALDLTKLHRDGCYEFGPCLSDTDRVRLLEHFDRLDASPRIPPGYQPQYDGDGASRRLRKLRRMIWNDRSLFGPILNRMGAPDVAERIIGPGAVLILHAAFLKPAYVGTHVAPHQDQALWSRQYPRAFSMWVALTEVCPDNGGLYGYPGSHAGGVIPHQQDSNHPWHDTLTYVAPQLGAPYEFRLAPGEAVIWDRAFVHASRVNTSPHDRRGMVIVFADGGVADFQSRDSLSLAQLRALADE